MSDRVFKLGKSCHNVNKKVPMCIRKYILECTRVYQSLNTSPSNNNKMFFSDVIVSNFHSSLTCRLY